MIDLRTALVELGHHCFFNGTHKGGGDQIVAEPHNPAFEDRFVHLNDLGD